jgi:Lipase (class 3)
VIFFSFLHFSTPAEQSSSGGALATLCSLELATQDGMSGPDLVSVYTFGSPRTGNAKFANLYDGLVKSHWRCVVAGDATVSTPVSLGYEHAGKTALFTRNGQLTLEKVVHLRWWQSETSSHPMYKLTSYFCALTSWSLTHSGQDANAIGLWDWPLDTSTSALFSSNWVPLQHPKSKPDVENPPLTPATNDADDIVAFSK